MRQRVRLAEIFAVARRILRDQDQFLHAFFRQLMCLGDNRSKTTAAKMSTHLWNETERARAVTAFSDLDESIMAGSRQHPRRRFIVEISSALIAKLDHWQRPRIRVGIAN